MPCPFVPDQKCIYVLWQSQTYCDKQKEDLYLVKLFCAGIKVFDEVRSAVKILGWLKKFGSAKNILGPIKGQGIGYQNDTSYIKTCIFSSSHNF